MEFEAQPMVGWWKATGMLRGHLQSEHRLKLVNTTISRKGNVIGVLYGLRSQSGPPNGAGDCRTGLGFAVSGTRGPIIAARQER